MTKKKNRFWTFWFSFIPGAGEMYMGFMKMGVSLMALFGLIFFLAVSLNMTSLLFIDVVVWFYGFFHAHNLRAMDDEDFYALEDDYLFHVSDLDLVPGSLVIQYRKVIGAGLVLWGASMLWRNIWNLIAGMLPDFIRSFLDGVSYRLPQMVLAVVVIWIGVIMIRGKKQELYEEAEDMEEEGQKRSMSAQPEVIVEAEETKTEQPEAREAAEGEI